MTDISSDATLPTRYTNGRFGPGNPGRRPGARGLAHRVTVAILEDFMAHKTQALDRARGDPHAYMRYVLKLLPVQVECTAPGPEAWSDADVDEALARVRAALTQATDGRGALIELESVLLGEGPAVPIHRI